MPSSLEELVTGERFGGLVEASDEQRAILRLADGRPSGLTPERERELFGRNPSRSPQEPAPDTVGLVCGRGAGKSRLAAGAAVWGALVADLDAGPAGSAIDPADEVRSVVLAPTADLAGQTFSFAKALVTEPSPLAALVVGKILSSSFVIRRPSDGRLVEVVVSAASSSGTSIRGRWLCTVVLEECAFFGVESKGYAVNAEDIERAVRPRLRHQLWGISSPNGPEGWLYELWRSGWQQHTPGELVCQAATRTLNPSYPQSKVDRAYRKDPDAAAREVGAQWTDAEATLLPSTWLDACSTRTGDAPRLAGARYVAAMDPATRSNAWTVAIATRLEGRVQVACVREWQGSKTNPLDTGRTIDELRAVLAVYGLTKCETDQWCSDALISQAREHGVTLAVWPRVNEDEWQQAQALKHAMGAGQIELPIDPQVREDLLGAKRVLTPRGTVIKLPTTANGRHCDYFPSIAKAHFRASSLQPWLPPASSQARAAEQLRRDEEADERAFEGASTKKWWKR